VSLRFQNVAAKCVNIKSSSESSQ